MSARTVADRIETAHDAAIFWHNRGARPWATMRRAARLARDLATAQASIRGLIESLNAAQTDRDAIADRMLDLARELEALRAAVRAHEERRRAGWPTPNPWNQADLDLWAAAKVTP